jgi:hypothetical protein
MITYLNGRSDSFEICLLSNTELNHFEQFSQTNFLTIFSALIEKKSESLRKFYVQFKWGYRKIGNQGTKNIAPKLITEVWVTQNFYS